MRSISSQLIRVHVCSILLVFGIASLPALSAETFSPSLDSQLPNYPEKTQIAIALVTPESTLFRGFIREHHQWRDIENRDSVFEIGSITKIFTGTLLAMLVQSGTVRLDEPISGLVPFALHDYPPNGIDITLSQLANHTSGLPDMPRWFLLKARVSGQTRAPYENYDTTALCDYLRNDLSVESPPGAVYRYSNLGFGLLGHLLATRLSGLLENVLSDSLFRPRGMTHTGLSSISVRPYLVRGLEADGEAAPHWDMGALGGAGAIKSSVADMARFAAAELSDISPASVLARRPTFRIESDIEIGLGWNIYHLGPDTIWYGHDGGTRGYSAAFRMDLGHQQAVVVLSNVSYFHAASNEIQNLCIALMREAHWHGF